MNKKHNKGGTAHKLFVVVHRNLAIDVVLKLAGLKEAASMLAHSVDVTAVTQAIAGLMI